MGSNNFMRTLNYASCNEDWRSEWKALNLQSTDKVLCITGSGDRPLDLIPEKPESIIAIDLNPLQNHLLCLKIAALECLSYSEYIEFLGLKSSTNRDQFYKTVRTYMPEQSKEFWDKHPKIIRKGIIYQGRWEKYFKQISRISRIMRPWVLPKLFEFSKLEDQIEYVNKKWDRWWWRRTFSILCSTAFSRTFFGDLGFFENVSEEMDLGKYIFDSMTNYLHTNLARDSFMMSLVFKSVLSEFDLPPYLDENYFPKIKDNLNLIQIETRNVIDYMNDPQNDGKFNAFSFSDVPSFLDQQGFEQLIEAMINAAAPNARFCVRLFLSGQVVPKRFEDVIRRDNELESQLRMYDRSFGYRFIAGKIAKDA